MEVKARALVSESAAYSRALDKPRFRGAGRNGTCAAHQQAQTSYAMLRTNIVRYVANPRT